MSRPPTPHKTFLAATVSTLFLSISVNATADLQSRQAGLAVYDTDLDISWVSDSKLAVSNQFGLTLSSNPIDDSPDTIGSTGLMTWDNGNVWIAAMNAANYLGFNDWRLPITEDADANCTEDPLGTTLTDSDLSGGYNCIDGEMGHLIYIELGGMPGTDLVATSDPSLLALFTNLVPAASYSGWSGEFPLNPASFAWVFEFNNGQLATSARVDSNYTWAVRDGDVGEPVADTDGDGVFDDSDNCTLTANPDQRDTNDDGFGNRCDPDLNNDGVVNFSDVSLWVPFFNTATTGDADFNGDGSANFGDFVLFSELFLMAPGPSGVAL